MNHDAWSYGHPGFIPHLPPDPKKLRPSLIARVWRRYCDTGTSRDGSCFLEVRDVWIIPHSHHKSTTDSERACHGSTDRHENVP
jgi:hypothetical protein